MAEDRILRRHRGAAWFLGGSLIVGVWLGCDGTTVVPVEVATVQVSPSEATLLGGQSQSFQAVPRGPDGNLLTGRFVTWSSEDNSVATVSSTGEVEARGPGTTSVTATIEGVSASSDLTVLPGPEIRLDPSALGFVGFIGDDDLSSKTVDITNVSENGQVAGLEIFIDYLTGGATGWLGGTTLGGATAPASISVRPNVFGLAEGSYTAEIEVRSTTAINSPQVVAVTLSVGEALPEIALSQTTAELSLPRLFPNPATVAVIGVTNSGGDQLSGLTRTIAYQGAATGWLTATLDGPTAPTNLRLVAQAGILPVGQYSATVDVRGSGAINNPQRVFVTLTITP